MYCRMRERARYEKRILNWKEKKEKEKIEREREKERSLHLPCFTVINWLISTSTFIKTHTLWLAKASKMIPPNLPKM